MFRSDVKGYYDYIDHAVLIHQLDQLIGDKLILVLFVQVIRRTVEWGEMFKEIKRGIGWGSLLSPLFASLDLKSLDDAMGQLVNKGVRAMCVI